MILRLATLLLLAAPAAAQIAAAPADADARFLTLDAASGMRLRLPTFDDTSQSLLFAPGERVQSVALSDPAAYHVNFSRTGDSLIIKPAGQTIAAVLRVQTDRAQYEIDLVPAFASEAPLVVRVLRGGAAPLPVAQGGPLEPQDEGLYTNSGDQSLLPSAISDDGAKTYLEWREDQAMPAVFGIGPSGQEEMVDGYMRGGIFTIDRVYRQLIFRIDRKKAAAKRLAKGGRR